MKTIIYTGIIFLLLNISSCTKKNEKAYVVTDYLTSKELIWETHKIPNEIFSPRAMFVTNDNLIVSKNKDETVFDVFSLSPFAYKFSGGIKGQGPNDFGRMVDFRTLTPTKEGFSVLDNGSIKQVEVTDQLKITSAKKLFNKRIPTNGYYALGDDKYMTFGAIDGTNEYNFFDKTTDSIAAIGTYPDWVLTDQSYSRFMTGIKGCVVHPDKSRFATFYGRMKHARIHNWNGDLLHDITIQTTPYLDNLASFNPKDAPNFYGYAQATDKYIYTLCANKLPGDDGSELKQTLEVWDWQGNPVACYRLNKKVSCIAISVTHKKIYGIDGETEHVLYSYDLPLY